MDRLQVGLLISFFYYKVKFNIRQFHSNIILVLTLSSLVRNQHWKMYDSYNICTIVLPSVRCIINNIPQSFCYTYNKQLVLVHDFQFQLNSQHDHSSKISVLLPYFCISPHDLYCFHAEYEQASSLLTVSFVLA